MACVSLAPLVRGLLVFFWSQANGGLLHSWSLAKGVNQVTKDGLGGLLEPG